VARAVRISRNFCGLWVIIASCSSSRMVWRSGLVRCGQLLALKMLWSIYKAPIGTFVTTYDVGMSEVLG
jgi:hypothetical protein